MSIPAPLPHLTGEPLQDTEEVPPLPGAPRWQHLQYYLFHVPREPRTVRAVFRWWEKRRLRYNIIVGCVGLLSVLAVLIRLRGNIPVQGLIGLCVFSTVVGIAANIGYCLGAVSELVLQRFFVRHHRHRVARVLMWIALLVSLAVVGTPGFLVVLGTLGIGPFRP